MISLFMKSLKYWNHIWTHSFKAYQQGHNSQKRFQFRKYYFAIVNGMNSNKDKTTIINKLIYAAAIIYPLTTVPQILQIFIAKNATNVSLWTWVSYDLFTLIFLWYAISNRLKPLVIEYSMWLVAQSIVVLGILLY